MNRDDIEVRDAEPAAEQPDAESADDTDDTAQYKAETERFSALALVAREYGLYSFSDGGSEFSGPVLLDALRGEHQDDDLLSARNLTVLDALIAMRTIARRS